MSLETLPLMLIAVASSAAVASIVTYLVMNKRYRICEDAWWQRNNTARCDLDTYVAKFEASERKLASARVLIRKLHDDRLEVEKNILNAIESSESLKNQAFMYLLHGNKPPKAIAKPESVL